MWIGRRSSVAVSAEVQARKGLIRIVVAALLNVTCSSFLIAMSLLALGMGFKKRTTAGLSQTVDEDCSQTPDDQTPKPSDPATPVVRSKIRSPHPTATKEPSSSKTREARRLPRIPDEEEEAEMSAGLNSSNQKNVGSGGGYGPLHLEYNLMSEYNGLHKQKLPGVYVIPSALTPLIWNCVIFVRQGLYQEAVFRFNLNIPENYPNGDCPRVFFEHPVFHPLVDTKTGELDVKREFKKWRKNVNQLSQVLIYVRRIFFKIDTKCPLNQEAADLYEQNMEQFKQRIVENIQASRDLIYNPIESNDTHAIKFSPWDSGVHDEARTTMLTRKRNKSEFEPEPHKKNGLSWIAPGSTQIFSQDDTS